MEAAWLAFHFSLQLSQSSQGLNCSPWESSANTLQGCTSESWTNQLTPSKSAFNLETTLIENLPKIDSIDSKLFGFNVGLLNSDAKVSMHTLEASLGWMSENSCRLISISIAPDRLDEISLLQYAGAKAVDLSLTMLLPNLSRRPRNLKKVEVRLSEKKDKERVKNIAGSIFEFGRYHRDPEFPNQLANKRFEFFIENAIDCPKEGECVFVAEHAGQVSAFMIVQRFGGAARWQLGGVAPDESTAMLGPLFFSGVADALESKGFKSARAKISAANTGVLNLYSTMGFIATKPEWVFHLHKREIV